MSNDSIRLPWRISDFLSGAWTSVSIIIALCAVIAFQVRGDSDRDNRIRSLEHNYDNLAKTIDAIDRSGSRISNERFSHLTDILVTTDRRLTASDELHDNRISLLTTQLADLNTSLNALRQIDILIRERQDNVLRRLDALEKEAGQIDVMRSDIARLAEQQGRIIQALDNTYNTLQEALRSGQITRKPTPGTSPPIPPW